MSDRPKRQPKSPGRATRPRAAGRRRAVDASAPPAAAATRETAIALAIEAERSKCTDVSVLDVSGLSPVCDFLVIATGTSGRQMRSVADDLAGLAKARGLAAWRQSTDTGSSWIVVDLVDIVVHLFEPGQRQYYDLEGLWGDGERVAWRPPSRRPARTPEEP